MPKRGNEITSGGYQTFVFVVVSHEPKCEACRIWKKKMKFSEKFSVWNWLG